MFFRYIQILLVVFISFFLLHGNGQSCVGRILYIGALEENSDKILGELLVILINERTGTNVKLRLFKDNDSLYEAFKSTDEKTKVDIIVENTADAAEFLKRTPSSDVNTEFAEIKDLYEKNHDIIWLNPFGFKNAEGKFDNALSSALIRRDILTNFPLLPRVINKLAGAIDDTAYSEMFAKVNSGDKANNVARDFLRERKLI